MSSDFNSEWGAIVTEFPIYYPDGKIAIDLGPGPKIVFYDDNDPQNVVSYLSPEEWAMGPDTGPQSLIIITDGQVSNSFLMNDARLPENTPAGLIETVFEPVSGQIGEQLTMFSPVLTNASEVIGAYILTPTLINNGAGPVATHAKFGITYSPENGVIPASDLFGVSPDGIEVNVPIIRDTWHNVVGQNGWSSFGTPYAPWSYKITAENEVVFRGIAKSGTTRTDGTLIATLPTGYYDTSFNHFVPVGYDASATNPSIVVDKLGNVTVFGVSTTAGDMKFDNAGFFIS